MNKLYDAIETCLQELENGADIETVLARYPDVASELRPILKASIKARMRSVAVRPPSPEVMRRGRAKLLQHASEMREQKVAPRRRMIPLFQRLAISFTLTALFLASGTGLVGASSSALPGENLYPVKLTWEWLRLFFTFDDESHELLEHGFENERLHEINELIVEGRHETIQFAGVFMEVNAQTYVSGIRIVILDTTVLPAAELLNGAAVTITGRTNVKGFVEAESIELLPVGTIVPTGEPPELESERNHNGTEIGNDNRNENINDNGLDNSSGNSNADGNENGDSNTNVDDNGNDKGSGSGDGGSGGDGNDGSNDDNSGSGGGGDDGGGGEDGGGDDGGDD